MHNFWYNSPVRFYKNADDLRDYTNPQNNQYFGELQPYSLEAGELHRFLIPQYGNDLEQDNYTLFIGGVSIFTVCRIIDGKLKYITFQSDKELTGRMELKNSSGDVVMTSNCVRFINSEEWHGQKLIRVATKHHYNRCLFPYDLPNAWFVTTLPAYCLGLISVQAEIANSRIGGNSTLKTNESYLDESVSYQFVAGGDGNVLNFIQAAVVNNYLFIDGTQRTSLQKMDADEFSQFGKINFVNVKNPNGTNILLDYDDIFSDLKLQVVSVTPDYGYKGKAADYSGLISIRFNNPVHFTGGGSITVFKDGVLYPVVPVISGDTVIINTNVLPTGNYSVSVAAGTVRDNQGETNDLIEWEFSLVQEFQKSVTIQWEDGTITDKSGDSQQVTIYKTDLLTDPDDVYDAAYWEKWNGSEFIFLRGGITTTGGTSWGDDVIPQTFELQNGENKFRLTLVTKSGIEVHSNVLTYNASIIKIYPTQEYWFKAIHPGGSSGIDKVVYLDENGVEQEHYLERSTWYDLQYREAPCERIVASEILHTYGAEPCTP